MRIISAGLLVGFLALTALWAQEGNQEQPREATIKGRLLCLACELNKLYNAGEPCAKGNHKLIGVKADNGSLYTLLDTRSSRILLAEKRLWDRAIELKARQFPKSQILEVTTFLMVNANGKKTKAYYWCDTCQFGAVEPGPCNCCQMDVVFKEEPVSN